MECIIPIHRTKIEVCSIAAVKGACWITIREPVPLLTRSRTELAATDEQKTERDHRFEVIPCLQGALIRCLFRQICVMQADGARASAWLVLIPIPLPALIAIPAKSGQVT